ncbi:MAG: hypothetical protein QG604_936 [Candidatus Dependentiae bacterium]|nr:hypothetical protein [Candidatus Dependentiae bacterium]
MVCLSAIGVPIHAGVGSSKPPAPKTDTSRKTEKAVVVSHQPSAPVKHVFPPESYVPKPPVQQSGAHKKKSRSQRLSEAVPQSDAHRESSVGNNHFISVTLEKAMSPERKKALASRVNTPARAMRRQLRAMQQTPESGRPRRGSEFEEWTRIFSESFMDWVGSPSPSTPQPVVETNDVAEAVIVKSEVLEPTDSSVSESNGSRENLAVKVEQATDGFARSPVITKNEVVSDSESASDGSESEHESITAVVVDDLIAKIEKTVDSTVPLQAVPVIVPSVAVATSDTPVAVPIVTGKPPIAPLSIPASTPQQLPVLQPSKVPGIVDKKAPVSVVSLPVMSDEEKSGLNNVFLKALGIVLVTPGLGYFLYLLITKGVLRSYEDLAMILRTPAIYKSLTSRRKIEAIAAAIAPLIVVTGTTMICLGSRDYATTC